MWYPGPRQYPHVSKLRVCISKNHRWELGHGLILERLKKPRVLFQFIRPISREGPWHSCKGQGMQTSAMVSAILLGKVKRRA